MLSAILYASNAGSTKRYAELLSQKTGLPAYNIQNSIPPATRGTDVVFLGWLMAGNVQGYSKVRNKFNVRALVAVGMAPKEQDQTAGVRKLYKLPEDYPLFYLQGGFDIKKLRGVYKFMMQVMVKKIRADVEKLDNRTPEQEAMFKMATEGLDCVSESQLADIVKWYETL